MRCHIKELNTPDKINSLLGHEFVVEYYSNKTKTYHDFNDAKYSGIITGIQVNIKFDGFSDMFELIYLNACGDLKKFLTSSFESFVIKLL